MRKDNMAENPTGSADYSSTDFYNFSDMQTTFDITPSDQGSLPTPTGGVDQSSDYASVNFFTPSVISSPGGAALIEARSNNEFPISYDQSKINSSIFDILKSGTAAVGAGIAAQDKTTGRSFWDNVTQAGWRNFASTQTGKQVQKNILLGQAQHILSNPLYLVMIAVAVGIGLFFFAKHRRR